MPLKRALIVDDSKSARVILSRVLEQLELEVHATESAESALSYLREHRPDVIFMDHLMSGMDGLAAVKAIKSDPSTSAIPIMMYTSQDGELYAGEARALGAAGVLPKRLAPADISRALCELEVLRTVHAPPAISAVSGGTATAPLAASALPPAADNAAALAALLREQGTDLRRFVVAALEGFSVRVATEVGAQVEAASARSVAQTREALAGLAPLPPAPVEASLPTRRPHGWMALAAAALLAAAGSAAYAWQQHGTLSELRGSAAVQERALAAANEELSALRSAPAGDRFSVPYGEVPLSGERLAALERLLGELAERGAPVAVTVTSHAGEFCLTGNPAEGYSPAPGEMPANRCDVVGNPFDEAMTAEQRRPGSVAALITAARAQAGAPVTVTLRAAGRDGSPAGYPAAADVSAAQWNAAAVRHNYVEVAVEPQPRGP